MTRFLLTLATLLILTGQSWAAILISNVNGGLETTTVTTLDAARTGASYANKTITVTSALTQAQSNITGAWPADRTLKIEKGGSIANSTAFVINGPFYGSPNCFKGTDGTVSFGESSGSIDVRCFAKSGLGTTASPWTGWDTAITWAGKKEFKFPAGVYSHSASFAVANSGGTILSGDGMATKINFTGTGNCFSLGYVSGTDGLTVRDLWINGNSNATNGIQIYNIKGVIIDNVTVSNVSAAGLYAYAGVVGNISDFRVSKYATPAQTTIPVNGIVLGTGSEAIDSVTTFAITNPIIEGVSGDGIKIVNGWDNSIVGGTAEENGGYGLNLTAGAHDNTIRNLYLEANNALISGANNSIIDVYNNPGTTTFDATSYTNTLRGSTVGNVVIASGATGNIIDSVRIFTSYSDLGTNTVSINTSNSGAVFGLNRLNGKIISKDLEITPATGTGVTVNSTGHFNRQTYIVTVTHAALSAAGLTADKLIATIPNRSKIVGVISETTTPYTGGTVSAATMIVGTSIGNDLLVPSHDVYTTAVVTGLTDASTGYALQRANAVQGGYFPTWSGLPTTIYVRLTTVGANTNALTAGSTTFYITTEYMGY